MKLYILLNTLFIRSAINHYYYEELIQTGKSLLDIR